MPVVRIHVRTGPLVRPGVVTMCVSVGLGGRDVIVQIVSELVFDDDNT